MPLLTGAVTALTLAGTPGLPLGDVSGKDTGSGASRTYSAPFSRIALTGTPGVVNGDFSGKAEKAQDEKFVQDSIRLYVTEGPVSDVEILISEVLAPRVVDSAVAGVGRPVSDSIRPRVTDTVQFLDKAGTIPKAASDTITPVVSEAGDYRVIVAVADTVTAVVTDEQDLGTADEISVSDSIIPVVSEINLLQQSQGLRQFFVIDTVRAVIVDQGRLQVRGEVDMIRIVPRPYGLIRITHV